MTIPFGINVIGRNSEFIRNPSGAVLRGSGVSNGSGVGGSSDNEELRHILYFSIVFAIIEIIIIYGKYDFLNVSGL